MAHIHTKPGQHDHTASAYIIRLDTPEPTIVLHMHKKFGLYIQFGGHIELDETPWQAIAHELVEESGYDLSQLKLLQPKDRMKKINSAALHPYAVCHNTHAIGDAHYHTDIAYAFITHEPPKAKVAPGESEDIRLFTQKELSVMPDMQVRDVANFVFDTCLEKWEAVSPSEFEL